MPRKERQLFQRLRWHQTRQKKTQPGPVGDEEQRKEQEQQEGQGRFIQSHHRLVEPGTGDEQVQAHGRGVVADGQVGQKDDAQVDRVNPESVGQGNDQGDHH